MANRHHAIGATSVSSPAHHPAQWQAPSQPAIHARHQLLGGRAETASSAAQRTSRTPMPSRVSTASSFSSGSHNLRALRHSNHDETSGGDTALSRHHSIHSQPLPHRNYPGTPGATRSTGRMLQGGANGAARPLTHTLGSSSSLTTSPTRRSYKAAAAAAAAAAAKAALPADDVLCRILGSCLPSVFEALAKFQYHQATSVLETFADDIAHDNSRGDVRLEWKSWDVFAVMVRLAASCESAYHLMRYLEPDMLHTETLEQLYNKLVVLLNHLVDDILPVLQRAQQRNSQLERTSVSATASMSSATRSSTSTSANGVHSVTSDEALQSELERLTLDDLEYYHGLLNQAAQFFVLRVSMLGVYRGLATERPPHKYTGMAKTLERLIKRYSQFDHPLLVALKQSAIEELRTVNAAFESEMCMAQYDFTKSMVALHRFKTALRVWSDHIDSVSEYPLFDDTDDDDESYLMSGTTYSQTHSVGSSMFQMQQHASAYADSQFMGSSGSGDVVAPPTGSLPRAIRESSFRRKSFTSTLASASDMAAFAAASEQAVAAAAAAASTPTAPESQNAFSRLISQRGGLLRRGLSVTSLRTKIQATSSSSQAPATPPNALEHAILGSTPSVVSGMGSLSTSMLTPSGNGLSSVGGGGGNGGGTSGFNTTNTHTLAAEMMASAVAKQEREDGYALPVYQWSKRFYRSLVAKFTLYFHRWLEPFESRGDALSPFDLTRFIRSPVGISYLQLIDVLLAKGSHRVEDGTATIMLILETDKLDNKGAKFYANGYLCPGASHNENKSMSAEAVKPVKKMGYAAKAAAASRTNSVLMRSSKGGALTTPLVSSLSSDTNASSLRPSHSLFNLNVDTEADDEANGDFAPLWGLRGWPAVFCYPHQESPPLQHWPNLVSLIMDNRSVLEGQGHGGGRGPVVHTERRLKTSYYITSVDPAVFLVLVLEGKRRPSEKTTQDFMQTMTENLQHNGVYQRGGSANASSKS